MNDSQIGCLDESSYTQKGGGGLLSAGYSRQLIWVIGGEAMINHLANKHDIKIT